MNHDKAIHHRVWPITAKLAAIFLAAFTISFATIAATTNSISPGQIINGTITLPDQTNYYSFTAASNDVIYLTLLKTNGPGTVPYFYLYDPAGNILAAPAYNSFEANWAGRLNKTGTYTVGVIDNNLDETFDYLLRLTVIGANNLREPGDGAEAIVPGQITNGHISPADFDTFTFTAASNDVIYLTLLKTNGPGTVPYFYLYDPAGNILAAPAYNSFEANWAGRLNKTGTYTVGVIDNNLDETFDYLLRLTVIGANNLREPGDGAEAIVPGQITNGHISPADFDTFTFTAASNDVIYLTLLKTNGPGTVPYFYLYDPAGNILAAPAYNSFEANWAGRLNKTGTYTVGVIDNNLDETFDYNICMIKVPGPNFPDAGEGTELLTSGETRAAQITPGDLDAYRFDVVAGDKAWITLTKTSGAGQLYAQVFGPDGNVIATAATTSRTQILLPCSTNTGTYTISCFEAGLSQAFTYNLTLVQDPGPPPSYDPDRPYMAVFRCMTNTVVRWPSNAAGFELEHRENAVSGTWSNLPPPYAVIANHYYVTNQSAAPMRFYRLNRPAP